MGMRYRRRRERIVIAQKEARAAEPAAAVFTSQGRESGDKCGGRAVLRDDTRQNRRGRDKSVSAAWK